MNFTREPIIETIISPRDGFKLLVRNSKGGGAEEYFVDALEVVSFGHAFFFRSLERPKSFIVPVSDYEVLEVKETRVALKNVSHERSIKIGGGREGPVRQHAKEPVAEKEIEAPEVAASSEAAPSEVSAESSHRGDKRRDRRRHRRRRSSDDQEWTDRKPSSNEQENEPEATRHDGAVEGGGANEETKVSSSMFSSLFPPPPTLISETLSRYKDKEFSFEPPHSKQAEKMKEEPPLEEPKSTEVDSGEKEEKHKGSDSSESDSSPLHRVAADHAALESSDYMSTYFSPLNGSPGFDPYA
ncbi:MAG: hypothetical protein K2P51_03580 [Rhabdochlamydiaceae bacterium]|nr:hypothetical protein [Rhabdochlamydiaceae bacterium]